MQVSIVIPTFNEAESIGQVLREIPRELVREILVVDSGSTDGTVDIALAGGARVIHEPRRGYGRACATGAAEACGDVVVYLDGDGADDPRRLDHLLAPLRDGRADLVLGSRLLGKMQPGAMPGHQWFGNWLAGRLLWIFHRLPLTDLSPFRAVRRAPLLALNLQEMTYGWPVEMITRACRQGLKIVEVPVGYRPRLGGHSKITGTWRGSLKALINIARIIWR
jgi:cellulose synthase/poly-beta-1,6-N-acetylglucosamine synthase-like glycosyltransferase